MASNTTPTATQRAETLWADAHCCDDTHRAAQAERIKREWITELTALIKKADAADAMEEAYRELRMCFRGDPKLDGTTVYMTPDMVRVNLVLNRHRAALSQNGGRE